MTTTQPLFDVAKYREQIDKLLRLAEGAATEQERESANAMAQRLMQKHSIDMAEMAAQREADSKPEEIKSEEFIFLGTLGEWFRSIGWAIVLTHPAARGVQSDRKAYVKDDTTGEYKYVGQGAKRKKKTQHEFVLEVTAFESDLESISYLMQSIRTQSVKGLEYYMKYTRSEQLSDYALLNDDNGAKYRDRRQWLMSYADGLKTNIRESRRKATEEAVDDRARVSTDSKEIVRQGVSLALRTRRESVNDWFDTKYAGSLRRSRSRSVAGGTGSASSSGFGSGRSANISGPGARAPKEIG